MDTHTFSEAAESYATHGGEARFLSPLIGHFGPQAVSAITPMAVRAATVELYPTASAATRNRQVITPARAVLNHAHELGWRMPTRIRLFPTSGTAGLRLRRADGWRRSSIAAIRTGCSISPPASCS